MKCGYCQKTACESWHKLFNPSCKYCREKRCKKCHSFNVAKKILLENADSIAKNYIKNFIRDFLCISDQTLSSIENDFNVERVPIKETHTITKVKKIEVR